MKDFDYDELFPGRFLKSGQFKGAKNLTITRVELEEMEDRKGKRPKPILSFAETKLQLVLNKTNGECVKGMFGRAVRDWIGKRITCHPVTVESFGEEVLAIRVKGSPDIAADMPLTLNLGQKSRKVTMLKTPSRKAAPAPAAAPSPAATSAAAPAIPPEPEDVGFIPEGVDDSAAPWNSPDPDDFS